MEYTFTTESRAEQTVENNTGISIGTSKNSAGAGDFGAPKNNAGAGDFSAPENQAVVHTYKDTVFRMLFSDKKELLVLYNAVNGTDYDNPDDLQITTLENAIYMSYKNDISFVLDFRLSLFEHQSTVNPNMPLRDLIYVTRVFEGILIRYDLYSSKLIRLPNPQFITFYNGMTKQPERRIYRLSDAFEKPEKEPSLELIVT